jgi:hypothetical protein
MEVDGQHHAHAALPPESKARWPRAGVDMVAKRKIPASAKNQSGVVQSKDSYYNDLTIPVRPETRW